MAKILIILRHGHAEQTHKDSSLDFERALTAQGREEVAKSALKARTLCQEPIQMLVSAARRTRQTAEEFRTHLGLPVSTEFNQSLYHADAKDWLDEVSQIDESIQTLILVGHNPSVSELSSLLSKKVLDMSTGSITVFSTAKEWDNASSADWIPIAEPIG